MNRLFLIITLALVITKISGQSADHRQVEGTNLFLIPPTEFQKSDNFKGFQNPEDPYSMIMIVEMPGPFLELSGGFEKERLEAAGMTLRVKEDRQIAGKDGLYIELDQSASGVDFTKSILLFGDEENSVIVNATCLLEDAELYESLKKAIGTVIVDTALMVDPRMELDFTVDETEYDLQFVAVVGNGILLNRDGLIPSESEDGFNVLFDKSYAEVAIGDVAAFSRKRIQEIPGGYEVDENRGLEDVVFDALEGKALWASNTEGEKLYQVILPIEEGGYYTFTIAMNI